MSDYSRQHDFSAKDSLPSGDHDKLIVGADVDDELDAVKTAVNSKIDIVTGHTTDNIGSINATGKLADSGYAASDFCQDMPVTDRTADFTWPSTGLFKMQRWTEATSAAKTCTLPAASSFTIHQYGYLENGSDYDCTITPDGTDTINGTNASVTLRAGQMALIVCDTATGWVISITGDGNLDDLLDVDAASPSDGEMLAWNAANSAWENTEPTVQPGADTVSNTEIDWSMTTGAVAVTSGSPWTPTEGWYTYTVTNAAGTATLEVFHSAAWNGDAAAAGGSFFTDGSTVRFTLASGTSCSIAYAKLD